MEDHLKNKSRLQHEWEALCAYEVDPCATNAALQKKNANKNRYPTILPYDHSRVILDDSANTTNSDYINANTIVSIIVLFTKSYQSIRYIYITYRLTTILEIQPISLHKAHCPTPKPISGR